MSEKPAFSGWATKYNILCSDGRTIMHDAFIDQDGAKVPLVWGHNHEDPEYVLGHAILSHRSEGMWADAYLNNGKKAKVTDELVHNGDIDSFSIWANKLRSSANGMVAHGEIKELSVVLAGANRGAKIENVLMHGELDMEEAVIYGGVIEHSDSAKDDETPKDHRTLKDIYNTMTDAQKDAITVVIATAMADMQGEKVDVEGREEVTKALASMNKEQRDVAAYIIGESINELNEGEDTMKHNAFQGNTEYTGEAMNGETLSHDEFAEIMADAESYGSVKRSFLAHGITNIEYLFPDARNISNEPDLIERDKTWVDEVISAAHKTPFAKVRSIHANITADEARAKGYIKGNQKTEEVFPLLKRETDPTTIYKKQEFHRDDLLDITTMDVLGFIRKEMRGQLNEEIARAILVSDGRMAGTNDKIDEAKIRPIWKDNDLYTVQDVVNIPNTYTDDQKAKAYIRSIIKSRKLYKGSGNPVFFTTEDVLTDMLLIEDSTGRVIYDTEEKLRTALRVRKIVTVPVMEGLTRTVEGATRHLIGIIVNMADYNIGTNKGGEVTMFDDFDIDINKQKYLMETRFSGALVKPYSAIVVEAVFQ